MPSSIARRRRPVAFYRRDARGSRGDPVTQALRTLVLIAQTGLPATVQERIVRQSPEFQQVSRMALQHLSAKSDA